MVSSDQGFVMLAVNHEHGISQLFSSTNNGTKYRKVLNNVRYFERKQNNLLADTGNQTKTVINLNKTNYYFYQIKQVITIWTKSSFSGIYILSFNWRKLPPIVYLNQFQSISDEIIPETKAFLGCQTRVSNKSSSRSIDKRSIVW